MRTLEEIEKEKNEIALEYGLKVQALKEEERKVLEAKYKELMPTYNSNRHIQIGWFCKKSPIKKCLWDNITDADDGEQCCMFCENPSERK